MRVIMQKDEIDQGGQGSNGKAKGKGQKGGKDDQGQANGQNDDAWANWQQWQLLLALI